LPNLLRRNLDQLVSPRFPHKDGDLIVGWLAAICAGELLNCRIPLPLRWLYRSKRLSLMPRISKP